MSPADDTKLKAEDAVQDDDAVARALTGAADQDALVKPDWSMWSQMLEAVVTQATALSCDIDPERIRGTRDQLKEYFRRAAITSDRIRCGDLKVVTRPWGVNPAVHYVRLTDYARMAEGLGWSLPPEFPRPTPAVPIPAIERAKVGDPRPLGTKERTSLLAIIGALVSKTGLSIEKPTETAKFIVDALAEIGVTIGQRTVEEHLKRVPEALDRKG